MSDDSIIAKIAGLIAKGKHTEAILEADQALQAIRDTRFALEERERQVVHLRSSAEIILQTVASSRGSITTKSDPGDPAARKRQVIDAALTVVRNGKTIVSVEDVKNELDRMQVTLGVTRPGSVIGTILNGDSRFIRRELGVFQYTSRGVNS